MDLNMKLLVSLLLAVSTGVAQAKIYNVAAEFKETMTNGVDTFFNGTFDWDGAAVTNLTGTMNSSMYPVNNQNPDYVGSFPLINLAYQLDGTRIDGNIVTASVFKENTTDVYRGGGYDGAASMFIKYGGGFGSFMPVIPGETPNENAFFTLVFDMTTMTGEADQMVYGDCTAGGLMGSGCMAGEFTGTSMMAGYPLSLSITPASVPLPATVWLFGSALLGFLGFNGRNRAPSV